MKKKFAIVLGVVMAMAMPLSSFAATLQDIGNTGNDTGKIGDAIESVNADPNQDGNTDDQLDRTSTYVVDESGNVVDSQGFGQAEVVTNPDGTAQMTTTTELDADGNPVTTETVAVPVVRSTIAASVVGDSITNGLFASDTDSPALTIKATANANVKSYAIVMTDYSDPAKPVKWLVTGITQNPEDSDGNIADIVLTEGMTTLPNSGFANVPFGGLTSGNGCRIVVYALNTDGSELSATTAASFETDVAGKVLYSSRVQGRAE